MTEHKSSSEEKSVEQNLAKDYVGNSKMGSIPMSNQIDAAMKAKADPNPISILPRKANNILSDIANNIVPKTQTIMLAPITFLELQQSRRIPAGICIQVYA